MNDEQAVFLVTGAAGALGRSVVKRFVRRGCRLALLDRDVKLLAAAFPELAANKDHVFLAADVTSSDAVAEAVKASAALGPCAGLIHIAGGFEMGANVQQLSRETWMRMMDLNAWSFVCAARAVLPQLEQTRGRIVAISARAAANGAAQMSAYCAAKSALQRLVESLSHEVRSSGINVNSVAPSLIDTPANRQVMPNADHSTWVSADDLAEVIAFLACDAGASQIHGQHWTVDGLV
ncbi:MAG: short-chain dehydrogenase [Nevskia sp.]|nr:short-chain dehydrogenase [Nevskia sp.]